MRVYAMVGSSNAILLALAFAASVMPEVLQAQGIKGVVKKAVKDVTKPVRKVVEDVTKPITEPIEDLEKSLKKDAKRIEKEAKGELKRFDKDMKRNFRNFDREANNGIRNIGELGKATENLVERQLRNNTDALQAAGDRLLKGDILGAAEDLTESSLKDIQSNTYQAMQESSALRVIGQTAATAYGGPGGAAAFSAWMTYKGTDGNWDKALKAGAISGGTSLLMTSVNAQPVQGMDIAAKAAAAGIIAAAAVTASGGDEEDARKAFRDGFIWSATNDIYKNTAGRQLDARGSKGDPCPLGAGYQACLTANPSAPRLGINPMTTSDAPTLLTERGGPMVFLSRWPGMHGMSAFHDPWVDSWSMNRAENLSTIPIATVLTYKAAGVDVYGRIIETNIQQAKAREATQAKQE